MIFAYIHTSKARAWSKLNILFYVKWSLHFWKKYTIETFFRIKIRLICACQIVGHRAVSVLIKTLFSFLQLSSLLKLRQRDRKCTDFNMHLNICNQKYKKSWKQRGICTFIEYTDSNRFPNGPYGNMLCYILCMFMKTKALKFVCSV